MSKLSLHTKLLAENHEKQIEKSLTQKSKPVTSSSNRYVSIIYDSFIAESIMQFFLVKVIIRKFITYYYFIFCYSLFNLDKSILLFQYTKIQ